MDKVCLNKKEMGDATKNPSAEKIILLQVAQESKTVSDILNKQTKLEPVSKQYKLKNYNNFNNINL